MAQGTKSRPISGEALLDIIAAGGGRLQLYTYNADDETPGGTVVRVWPTDEPAEFAEFILDRSRESIVRDYFESVAGRPDGSPAI